MNKRVFYSLSVVVALVVGGSALAVAITRDSPRSTIRQDVKTIDVPVGSGSSVSVISDGLDPDSIRFAGANSLANYFVATSDEGFTCTIIVSKLQPAPDGRGCDPPADAMKRGQFLQFEMADGTAVGAYRSLQTVNAAAIDNTPVQDVEGVVPFVVPPETVSVLTVQTPSGEVRREIRTGGAPSSGPVAP